MGSIWLQCGREGWRRFRDPVEVLETHRSTEVLPLLARVEGAANAGLYAAGFLSYEAASAFDSALVAKPANNLPLLWFALFEHSELVDLPRHEGAEAHALDWRPSLDRDSYQAAVGEIQARIASGHTYQTNFTWRLEAHFEADPWSFFLSVANRDRTRYAAFLDTGEHSICSFSPELFFRLDGDKLLCRPMKGTAQRGRYRAEDNQRFLELYASAKDRAENVMIVDMVRNDLGRVARPGSIETTHLFEIESYPTVLQMTSTVTAESDASLVEILTALYPCASITGAPKVETMKIIAELEDRPRGIYTGAIGYVGPNRQALFNVAIRTVHVDRESRTAEYGTGGGIVWDSQPESEYLEGRVKTLVLASQSLEYSLLETMRWEHGKYHLLRRHLDRLADSADLLGFRYDESRVLGALDRLSGSLSANQTGGVHSAWRIRLLLARSGDLRLEDQPIEQTSRPWSIELARRPIDPNNRLLFHKSTNREVYDACRRQAPDVDDVLLWNPVGQLTETTVANVALELDGRWYTPPVACGLLAGTERAEWIATGRLAERILTLDDLDNSDSIALLNSVRGWIPARLATLTRSPTKSRRTTPAAQAAKGTP